MNTFKVQKNKLVNVTIRGIAFIFLWVAAAQAQVYSSGSTGTDGAFAPTSSMSLTLPPSGVFNFTTVNIPTGITVTFIPNAANTPVTLLATGDITIAGTINVNGSNGLPLSSSGLVVNKGGVGGPGGYSGGPGGMKGLANNTPTDGQGPGGGLCCFYTSNYHLPYGVSATYGAIAATSNSLIPLFGGSGGSGAFADASNAGNSGGGGGGAILIASSTKIAVTGSITANGGIGGNVPMTTTLPGQYAAYYNYGGCGSGGAIRLVASQITGTGSLQAAGGAISGYFGPEQVTSLTGGNGKIRLEAYSMGFSGSSNPALFASVSPGPVSSSSNPALLNLPTLTFSGIGTTPSPAVPGGSYTSADVSLPQGTTNPVTVNLAAANIPVGTVFTVRLIPQFGLSTSYNTSASTGTFSSSTATVPVSFPSGQVSVLNAYASFTVPTQVAALYPLIDGEPVERVIVAANYGEASTVTFFTKSGKEIKADQLLKNLR